MSTKLPPDYYLVSSEGYGLDVRRSCWRLRILLDSDGREFMVLRIAPPLVGQKYGLGGQDVSVIIATPRHQGVSLFGDDWPVHIFVMRYLQGEPETPNEIRVEDCEVIAWAELELVSNEGERRRGRTNGGD